MGVEVVASRRRVTRLRTVFARRKPLSCQQMVELVTAYLEDALAPRERAHFDRHLQGCEGCATYLEELRVTIAALGTTLVEEQLDPVFRDRLMIAFAEATNAW